MRARGLVLVLAFAAGGCQDRGGDAATPQATAASAPANVAVARARPASPSEHPDEVQLDALLGVWRVVGVVPGPAAKFAQDDPRIVGALMDVQSAALSWSYKPDPAFAPRDLCLGPVAGMIDGLAAASAARGRLAEAIGRNAVSRLSRPHAWLCGDGGSWGDDADFQVLGPDRIAMTWPGDLAFTLERIRRVAKDPPPLPPTGAFQDR